MSIEQDRLSSFAIKYTLRKSLFGREDVLPLWVADMDLPTAPVVAEAIRERAAHPIYGYTDTPQELFEAYIGWQDRRHGYRPVLSHLSRVANLVQGIQFALATFLTEGDGVVVQPPVYFPFFSTILNNELVQVDNPLVRDGDHYSIDFEDLERKLQQAKAMIFCSPHNPIGRVWTRAELEQVVRLCEKHDVLLICDEIHSDFAYQDDFIPIRTLSKRAIVFNSPGKTFNLAGLHGGFAEFPDAQMKERFDQFQKKLSTPGTNCFEVVGMISAYTKGDSWFDETKAYIHDNMKYVVEQFRSIDPPIGCYVPEGTYLMWLDFSAWKLDDAALAAHLAGHGVGLNSGFTFGQGGSGHMRLNAATPREPLEQAVQRIKKAAKDL